MLGERGDFFARRGHRRDRARGQQDVGGEMLRDIVGDAMDARRARPDVPQHRAGGIDNLVSRHIFQRHITSAICGKVRLLHLKNPSAGVTRIRFDGLAFASQPGWAPQ